MAHEAHYLGMIVAVEVGVALSRPPKLDRMSRVLVEVNFNGSFLMAEAEAWLLAIDMTMRPDVVMPVYAQVVDILEI